MSFYSSGADLDDGRRTAIEQTVRGGLGGLEGDIGHVHVRVYGEVEPDLYTCYVRVDGRLGGGIALGDTSVGLEEALCRAVSRIAAALRGKQPDDGWPAARPNAYALIR
jgi:hypothetical protein